MNALHGRLAAVERLCGTGDVFVDVGCDHGYLSLSLLKRGAFSRAFLSDINEKPLDSARNAFLRENVEFDAEFILTDGLQNIDCNGDFTVCICGMGGELISEILKKDLEIGNRLSEKAARLILQPMSRPEALRRFLFDNGFEIVCETAVSEDDKIYLIISAVYNGTAREYSEYDVLLGTGVPDGDGKKYLEKLFGAYEVIAEGKKKACISCAEEEKISAEIKCRMACLEK